MSFIPNTTPTPNWLYNGEMKKMNESELKVVLLVTRKTLGWFDPVTSERKTQDYISQSQFMEFTGQSNRAIATAIQVCVEHGWIIAKDRNGSPCETSEKRRRRKVWYQLGTVFTHKISSEESSLDVNLVNKTTQSSEQNDRSSSEESSQYKRNNTTKKEKKARKETLLAQVLLQGKSQTNTTDKRFTYPDIDSEGLPREAQVSPRKTNPNLLTLQSAFRKKCNKAIGVTPTTSIKSLALIKYALNSGGLTAEQILDLFDEWFSLPNKTDEQLIELPQALSSHNINGYKIRNNVK